MKTLTFGGTGASTSFVYNGTDNLEVLFENTSNNTKNVDAIIYRTDYNPGTHYFGVYGSGNSWVNATASKAKVPYNAAIVFNNNSPGSNLCNIPLPIKLTSFKAVCNKKLSLLTWTTETEINNDYYSIYRSTDGINWINIGQVAGVGNSRTLSNYSYIDKGVNLNETNYYKLKQTDFDGKYEEFSPVSLLCNIDNPFITMHANKNQIIISGKYEMVSITDILGRQAEVNNVDKNTLDISTLPIGVYVIRFDNGVIDRFVKE